MTTRPSRSWILPALAAGVAYAAIGRTFTWPQTHVQAWRLGAWITSGAIFAAQVAWEHFRLRNTSRSAAVHAAVGVAIGAFGLAAFGMWYSWRLTHHVRGVWKISLIVWPVITALPAFLVAWVAGVALKHVAAEPPR